MPAVIRLNGPSIEATVDASGALAFKRDAYLEQWAIAYDGFPADAEIVQSHIWSQQMADYPAGCYGNITWAVYGELYGRLSGVPAQERCQPIGLELLGRLLFRPGADQLDWRDHPAAIPYKPGQKIVFPFEVAGAPSRPFSIFPAVRVRSVVGFTELPGIVHHDLPNGSVVGGAHSKRSLIPGIAQGGTEVRVTVQSLWDGLELSRMSIGKRANGFNMAAAPVPITFAGQPGLTLAPYKTARSDWAPLTTQAGDALLVHSCITKWTYKAPGYDFATCWVTGTSGHDTAAFSGTVQPGHVDVIAMIEVR